VEDTSEIKKHGGKGPEKQTKKRLQKAILSGEREKKKKKVAIPTKKKEGLPKQGRHRQDG